LFKVKERKLFPSVCPFVCFSGQLTNQKRYKAFHKVKIYMDLLVNERQKRLEYALCNPSVSNLWKMGWDFLPLSSVFSFFNSPFTFTYPCFWRINQFQRKYRKWVILQINELYYLLHFFVFSFLFFFIFLTAERQTIPSMSH
jgi:hypothetical protein